MFPEMMPQGTTHVILQQGTKSVYQVYIIQIMPGLEDDFEEWQTQEVNVTRGEP